MAETKGRVVLCYDVSDKNTQVKDALKELKYLDWWKKTSTNTIIEMPDTTVWHTAKTVSEAVKDLEDICKNLKVVPEKVTALLLANEAAGFSK
jgi:predicted Rossmann fold nucleotide-binding protein DprA/Smf involved in DNA uptake